MSFRCVLASFLELNVAAQVSEASCFPVSVKKKKKKRGQDASVLRENPGPDSALAVTSAQVCLAVRHLVKQTEFVLIGELKLFSLP